MQNNPVSSPAPENPIGVFDSGMGGLSILQALRQHLPHEHCVYFADTAHAPYGERETAYIIERSLHIAQYLIATHHIKALVVACNTATAAAIGVLRQLYPKLILIGVEPALKPASQLSQTKQVAVLATAGTLKSQKFQALHQSLAKDAVFQPIACTGLAGAIEAHDEGLIDSLCQQYLSGLNFGHNSGQIDTVVLGCTHYPFVQKQMAKLTGPSIRFVETGNAVAKQTHRCLQQANLLAPPNSAATCTTLLASAQLESLQRMAQRHLDLPQPSQ